MMNILSWNIKGLCNPRKDTMLGNLVSEHKIEMLGLIETKLKQVDRPRVASIWGSSNFDFLWCYTIDLHSGDLILIWNT